MKSPPVPPDLDLRDFQFMPLDVMRLVDSDLTAIATGEEFKAAVILWCKAWHQVPASSLPDDERMLAHLSGYGRDLKGWKKVKSVALRGFERCSDGRLYHAVIAEKAAEAGRAKAARHESQTADAARKKREREEREKMFSILREAGKAAPWNTPTSKLRDMITDLSRVTGGVTGTVTGGVTAEGHPKPVTENVTAIKGQGQGQGQIEEDEEEATRAQTGDDFEKLWNVLRELPGISRHPIGANPVIGPIWGLLQRGFDLRTQIIPSIERQLSRSKRPIKTWAYLVDGIVEDAASAATTATPPNDQHGGHHGPRRQPPARDTFAVLEQSLAEQRARAAGEAGSRSQGSEDDHHQVPRVRQGSA